MKKILTWLFGKPSKDEKITFLPESVRYQLKYGSARLRSEHILSLYESRFICEAVYIASRLLEDNHKEHYKLIKTCIVYLNSNPGLFDEKFREILKNIPKDKETNAGKLAQISRQGFDHWQELYARLANILYKHKKVPIFVTHSTIIGALQFIPLNFPKIFFLIPDWVKEKDNKWCGYVLDNKRGLIPLKKSFKRPENGVMFDDIIRSGKTFRMIVDFWKEEQDAPEVGITMVVGEVPDKIKDNIFGTDILNISEE